jgi:uncharacterized protein (UPF0332 family)
MNWGAYLALAEGLAANRFEASARSAVSRAYYAAFNVSRRWLEANLTPIDNRGAHRQVWQAFKAADRATPATREDWVVVGSLGNSLRVLRNQADYDDIVLDLDGRVAGALRDAERILALLPELQLTD